MDRAEKAVGGQVADGSGEGEEERWAVLSQLSHLDELTPDDEEEIGRFRTFAAPPASPRGGSGIGRVMGHLIPTHRRVAS